MTTQAKALTPIERMIDAACMTCTNCGAKAGTCDCWTKCACGWSFEKGGACRNSVHFSPCPFCGTATAELRQVEDGGTIVMCATCGAMGPWPTRKQNAAEAVRLWNTRTTRAQPRGKKP